MEKKQKILVAGDVKGKFKTLFSRVDAINSKNGPFDFLFCVGDFFGDSSTSAWAPYKAGSLKVAVPTYVLGPVKDDQLMLYGDVNGCELCPNVNYLGKRGLLTSCGLSIAYLSGIEKEGSSTSLSQKDVTELKDIVTRSKIAGSSFLGVDILLTSVWPKNIMNNDSSSKIERARQNESDRVAWLTANVRPRYHFAGLEDVYYERPPYSNHHQDNESMVHCTRFIALANVGNTKKEKWLYAASLTPLDKMKPMDLYQVTTDETPCPFPNVFISAKAGNQYFYDMDASDETGRKRKGGHEKYDGKRQAIDQNTCWFCLASPAVEKHLVISIGEQVYLALAKGGITEYHALILPVQHHRSLAFITDDIKAEIKKFKKALNKMCKKLKMVPVYFERNYKTSHMQLQFIPVPKSQAKNLNSSFLDSSKEMDLGLEELPEHCKLEDVAQPDKPYFYVELPTGRFSCDCKRNFPLEFGRDVLAGEELLNLPHRVSWRDCIVSKDEESKLVDNFRENFKEFDFTNLDEDSD